MSLPFCQISSRKTELRKNYLFALSAVRITWVFGHSRANFTTEVTVVNFPSADWLSYLRTQLKEFVGGVCVQSMRFFLTLFSRIIFFLLRQTLVRGKLFDFPKIWTIARITYRKQNLSANYSFRNITSLRAISARSLHIF